jgi:hypothetical protein
MQFLGVGVLLLWLVYTGLSCSAVFPLSLYSIMEFILTALPIFTFTTNKFRNYFRKGMIKNMFSRIQGTQKFSRTETSHNSCVPTFISVEGAIGFVYRLMSTFHNVQYCTWRVYNLLFNHPNMDFREFVQLIIEAFQSSRWKYLQ